MQLTRKSVAIVVLILGTSLTVAFAATTEPSGTDKNSFYLYTGDFSPTESGVVVVPSRFRLSVETSWRGMDVHGRDLSDTRVMLRLYDPDHNSTALTAQLNLETAEKLQRELADIIAKKRQNPNFQYRPKLYSPSMIPTGRLTGISKDGEAIIELELEKSK